MAYDFLKELESIGALKRGHFVLSSGRHTDQYVEKFDLLRQPQATERACAELIQRLEGHLHGIDVIAGPTTGGILLAFEFGRQLGLPAAYAERSSEGSNERTFRRGTIFEPGTRVLVVDDVMTTGGSVRETLKAVSSHGGEVAAVAVLVDRSLGTADVMGYPLISLAQLDMQTWDAADVPAWLDSVPVSKPGTTNVSLQADVEASAS